MEVARMKSPARRPASGARPPRPRPASSLRSNSSKMSGSCLGLALILVGMFLTDIKAQCSLPVFVASHTMIGNQVEFPEAMEIHVSCFTGYTVASSSGGVEYITKCTGGTWVPQYDCTPVTCKGLPVVPHARVLYLSKNIPVDDKYEYAAETRVYCETGWMTANKRNRYTSVCAINSQWSETSPCSEVVTITMTEYSAYETTGVLVNFPYKDAYGNTDSEGYKEITEVLTRALFKPMTGQFHSLYVGANAFSFSKLDGDRTQVQFNALFHPSQQADADSIKTQTVAALASQDFTITDPTSGLSFTFEGGQFEVSGMTGFFITREAMIGLSVAGGLVAALAIALIVVCIVCRDRPCCTGSPGSYRDRWMKARRPYNQGPRIPTYPNQNTYGLPRTNIY